jgi:hypothetical protein
MISDIEKNHIYIQHCLHIFDYIINKKNLYERLYVLHNTSNCEDEFIVELNKIIVKFTGSDPSLDNLCELLRIDVNNLLVIHFQHN